MSRVVVSGLGFVSSIGNSNAEVIESLRELRHGFRPFPAKAGERCPPKFYGALSGYETFGSDPEDWTYPTRFKIPRVQLKSMSPHVLYAHCAMVDAIVDAQLSPEAVSNTRTGIYSASAGSAGTLHQQMDVMNERGVLRCSPFAVVASTVGSINFNLGASFKIKGAICGMASACASSAHALGFARDAIATGRQDRMFVIGAEDALRETLLPFAGMRALSTADQPDRASCPFDANRSGFVGSGGAVCLVLESEAAAAARGARVYAELAAWGEAGDGHSPAMSHPEGDGLVQAMQNALTAAQMEPDDVDYVSAHATSTPVGDLSEIRALKRVFSNASGPYISSTKALTGHPLSMAGALEAGIGCLAIHEGFIPGSAHIETLDPECAGLNILQQTIAERPKVILSNSSGFGGANVSLILKAWAP